MQETKQKIPTCKVIIFIILCLEITAGSKISVRHTITAMLDSTRDQLRTILIIIASTVLHMGRLIEDLNVKQPFLTIISHLIFLLSSRSW